MCKITLRGGYGQWKGFAGNYRQKYAPTTVNLC